MSPTVWPQYGSISYSSDADAGKHYSVAYPEWAQKPFNFGDFRRGARFANSLTNGDVLSKKDVVVRRLQVRHLQGAALAGDREGHVRHDQGDADANRRQGFVVPSNDEWVKAAYYDPKGGGTESYWAYPTGPFDPPNPSVLDPATGDVVNATRSRSRPTTRTTRTAAWTRPARRPEPRRPGVRRRPGRPADRHPFNLPLPPELDSEDLHGEREHGRPGEDALPVGHLRHGRQRRRGPRHTRAAAAGVQLPARLALLPRRRRQRPGLPGGDLGLRLLPADPASSGSIPGSASAWASSATSGRTLEDTDDEGRLHRGRMEGTAARR